MFIKYLKDGPAADKGEVRNVDRTQANVLIRLGMAEAHTEPKKTTKTAAKKKTAKKDTKTDESE